MKIIAGLGNPGTNYKSTRHNIGYMVIDHIAYKFNIGISKGRGQYNLCGGTHNNEKYILVQPTTYMNLSGFAIREVLSYYKCSFNELLVVCDDINLPVGSLRLRAKGGDGGHNGLYSITEQLGSSDYARLRIGVGSNFEKGYQADYVLSPFHAEEKAKLDDVINQSNEICKEFIVGGFQSANNYLSKSNNIPKEEKKQTEKND